MYRAPIHARVKSSFRCYDKIHVYIERFKKFNKSSRGTNPTIFFLGMYYLGLLEPQKSPRHLGYVPRADSCPSEIVVSVVATRQCKF
jgi:hypothetical protein